MADSKITQLPNFVGNPSGSEPMETVQSSVSVQITSQKIADLATIVTPVNLAGMTALISSNGISSYRLYVITNATAGRILVKGLTTNTLEAGALNLTTGESGTYVFSTDTFTAATPTTPDLQQVTDVGFTTTNPIVSDDGAGNAAEVNNGFVRIATGNTGSVNINSSQVTATYTAQLPAKATSPQTFAMLSDLTGLGGITKSTAAGTDTYTTTITGVTGYADGDTYLIRFTNGNTQGATLNIYNGTSFLGAKSLYRNNDGIIIGGDIWAGAEMLCVFNSTLNGFQCIGTSPNSLFAYVVNADSVTINRGQPVYAFGSTGNRMSVKLANNQNDATSAQTYGLVYSTSIAANQKGIIIIQGVLDGLNLGGTWADGDPVYLGASAGAITKTKPYAPDHLVYLGVVERANAGNGIMYVRVQNGYELQELHNVSAQTPNNGDILKYNNTTSLWESTEDLSIAYALILG